MHSPWQVLSVLPAHPTSPRSLFSACAGAAQFWKLQYKAIACRYLSAHLKGGSAPHLVERALSSS